MLVEHVSVERWIQLKIDGSENVNLEWINNIAVINYT